MIYLDNAATTRPALAVARAMYEWGIDNYGNASSAYEFGRSNSDVIHAQKEVIADIINANATEIYFTSGGSESDNWALIGTYEMLKDKGNHIITTNIEHHAILRTCEYLEERGAKITYLNVDKDGLINLKELEDAITPETIMISVMFANNEIGTIEPIKEIGALARKHQLIFHTDAVQAFGHVPIDVNECEIDLLSASAHKLNGPKGVGFLYIRTGTHISPLIRGGMQQYGMRAGTENVAGILGFGMATGIARTGMCWRSNKEAEIRDYMINYIKWNIPFCKLNGSVDKRLPNNVNFSFDGVDGSTLVSMLDDEGICVSTGSSCMSGSGLKSHVLDAIGLSDDLAKSSLRITPSYENTKEEIDIALEKIKRCVYILRGINRDDI